MIEVKTRGRITAYHYGHHPFDLVGWDGHLWPFAFNIGDFEPITGRVHQPPPVRLTFQPRNYVVCSLRAAQVRLPPARYPGAVQPLEHQLRRGHLLRRRQLHVAPGRRDQLVHDPPGRHPARAASGAVERRSARRHRGAGGDDRHVPPPPSHAQASELEDDRYPYSWIPPEDRGSTRRSSRSVGRGVPRLTLARRAAGRRAVMCSREPAARSPLEELPGCRPADVNRHLTASRR